MDELKKVLIWGTGKVAAEVEPCLTGVEIIGYIETKRIKNSFRNKRVYSAEECPKDYYAIIVAVSALYHENIFYNIRLNKIDEKKVCVVKPSRFVLDTERNIEIAKNVFNEDMYQNICMEFGKEAALEKNWVEKDAEKYSVLNTRETMKICQECMFPIYADKFKTAGSIGSYFWQDLWAARKIFRDNPERHYDIGSRIDGFIAHLLSFRDNVNLIDIRPLDKVVDGLYFTQSDATSLDNIEDESIESLSALCSLEHFGLGRYGDEIDPEACYKCFAAISRKMKSGGSIYLSVPVGKEHIEFNAHRVFYASTIVKEFSACRLEEYSCTKDGMIEYNVELGKYDNDMSLGEGRFGLFHFIKK